MMPVAVSYRNAAAGDCMTRPPVTRIVQLDGIGLNVERRGDGPTVLLLHGFPDWLRLWREVAPAGRQHYVIDRLVEDA